MLFASVDGFVPQLVEIAHGKNKRSTFLEEEFMSSHQYFKENIQDDHLLFISCIHIVYLKMYGRAIHPLCQLNHRCCD